MGDPHQSLPGQGEPYPAGEEGLGREGRKDRTEVEVGDTWAKVQILETHYKGIF